MTVQLRKLIINDLFGHFHHVINFKDGNITIITAPNGYGKTICLKIIDAIFNRRLQFFTNLSFSSIELFTSEGVLTLEKTDRDNFAQESLFEEPNILIDSIHLSKNVTVRLSTIDDEFEYSLDKEIQKNKKFPIHNIERYIPSLHRIGPREWEDHQTEEIYTLSEIINKFSELLPTKLLQGFFPEWYIRFSDSLNAHFIKEQRLLLRNENNRRDSRHRKSFTDTIEKYSDELSDLIRESGLLSSHVSQELDTSFPVRLLKKDNYFKSLTVKELKKSLQKIQQKRSDLSNLNLISSEQHLPQLHILDEIRQEDTKVLTLYVKDTEKKLAAYDDIFRKIELFSRILNKKRLSFKKVKIDASRGFYFVTDFDEPLKLTQLSSGEQHQVVLLYELIFKTEKNVLVLIDEPEISLHVAWQKEFLKDLQEIIEIQNMPVVIATHSPQIIDNNWHLTVDLGGNQ